MNPLTQIKNTQKATKHEIALGLSESASWHAKFKHSAYIFAGGLDYDLTEGDILAVFAQYGEIVDLHLVRDKTTGKSMGFAFVAYEDQRSTVLAVDNLSGARVAGRTVRVEHVDNYRKKKAEVEGEPIPEDVLEEERATEAARSQPRSADDPGPWHHDKFKEAPPLGGAADLVGNGSSGRGAGPRQGAAGSGSAAAPAAASFAEPWAGPTSFLALMDEVRQGGSGGIAPGGIAKGSGQLMAARPPPQQMPLGGQHDARLVKEKKAKKEKKEKKAKKKRNKKKDKRKDADSGGTDSKAGSSSGSDSDGLLPLPPQAGSSGLGLDQPAGGSRHRGMRSQPAEGASGQEAHASVNRRFELPHAAERIRGHDGPPVACGPSRPEPRGQDEASRRSGNHTGPSSSKPADGEYHAARQSGNRASSQERQEQGRRPDADYRRHNEQHQSRRDVIWHNDRLNQQSLGERASTKGSPEGEDGQDRRSDRGLVRGSNRVEGFVRTREQYQPLMPSHAWGRARRERSRSRSPRR